LARTAAGWTGTAPDGSSAAQAAERGGWLCHRRGVLMDRHERWPHPLALAGDHYPVPRCRVGPYNLAGIRAAHSLCNGSTSDTQPQAIPFTMAAAQPEVINQILARQQPRVCQRTCTCTCTWPHTGTFPWPRTGWLTKAFSGRPDDLTQLVSG
jgi:hypothetical protein